MGRGIDPAIPDVAKRQRIVPSSEPGIELDGTLEEYLSLLVFVGLLVKEMPKAAMIGLPCIQTVRGFPTDALALRLPHRRLNRRSNVSSNFVLYSKYVSEIAVISLRPEVGAGCRFDELCSESNAATRLTDAAFENEPHAEFAAHLLDVNRSALVRKA